MSGGQVPEQVLRMWKGSWETHVKTLKTAEAQGCRVLNLMLLQSGSLKEETKKEIKEWISSSKKVSKSYMDAVEQNVSKFEEILEPAMEPAEAKRPPPSAKPK